MRQVLLSSEAILGALHIIFAIVVYFLCRGYALCVIVRVATVVRSMLSLVSIDVVDERKIV